MRLGVRWGRLAGHASFRMDFSSPSPPYFPEYAVQSWGYIPSQADGLFGHVLHDCAISPPTASALHEGSVGTLARTLFFAAPPPFEADG